MIMNTFEKLYIYISLLIVYSWNLKKWINRITILLIIWNFHIEFHSKLFIVTKYAFKNEIIKLVVKFFSLKPSPNGNYGHLKDQNWTWT